MILYTSGHWCPFFLLNKISLLATLLGGFWE